MQPDLFWCVGCESHHLKSQMNRHLCPQCAACFNQPPMSVKGKAFIGLLLFGLVLDLWLIWIRL